MTTRRTITPEIRIIDAAKGIVDYVASDETLDCYHEVIRASGWRFDRFQKNAPFVDSHDYGCIEKLLGRVASFEIKGNALVERVHWAIDVPENALAQLGWKMTQGGYLRAVSVGFMPVKVVSQYQNPAEFAQQLAELKLTAERVQCVYLEQQQIELSACIIGANPNALAKAQKDGCVADADLDACGFADEDMEALHATAEAIDHAATEAARLQIRLMWKAYSHAITFRKKPAANPAPADGPDAADADRHRDAAFLAEFQSKIKSITQ